MTPNSTDRRAWSLPAAVAAGTLLAACSSGPAGPTPTPPDTVTSWVDPSPADPPTADLSGTARRTQRVADRLVGLTEEQAEQKVAARPGEPLTLRVVERDGVAFPVTMDYSPTRINLTINQGRITAAEVG